MKKGTSNEAWAILSIILLLFVIIFSIGFLFKIPGFAGKFLGFIGQGLVNLTAGFWSWLRGVIGGAINHLVSQGVKYFTIGLLPVILSTILSYISQRLMSYYITRYLLTGAIPPWLFNPGAWGETKWFLIESLKELIHNPGIIVNALKYAVKHPGAALSVAWNELRYGIIGAIVALIISFALRAIGLPEKIDSLVGTPQIGGIKLHIGAGVTDGIAGAVGGAVAAALAAKAGAALAAGATAAGVGAAVGSPTVVGIIIGAAIGFIAGFLWSLFAG